MSTLIVFIILIEYEIPILIYLLIWWFALALPNIYIYIIILGIAVNELKVSLFGLGLHLLTEF